MKKQSQYQYATIYRGNKDKPTMYGIYNDLYKKMFFVVIGQEKKMYTFFPGLSPCKDIAGRTFETDGYIVIWLKEKGSLSVFAHELVHAISFLFIDRGIKLSSENDEPAAYLTEWMFRAFYFVVK